MIDALLNGKAARRDVGEDVLTSTVFGVLRHLPVAEVWLPILKTAVDRQSSDFANIVDVFEATARAVGANIAEYTRANVSFWPQHAELGEPDLLVTFTGADPAMPPPPVSIIIEVKLWSQKGRKNGDQLQRYFRALQDRRFPEEALVRSAVPIGLVYLTALASAEEVDESTTTWRDEKLPAFRCFELAWQDVTDTLRRCAIALRGREPVASMASEVAHFLKAMGLERFRGFSGLEIPEFDSPWKYSPNFGGNEFWGITALPELPAIETRAFYHPQFGEKGASK